MLPLVGPDHVGPAGLVVPVELASAQGEDAAQHQSEDPLRVALGVGESQGGSPRPAEDEPALHAQVLAQCLHVRDQVPGGVHRQIRPRLPGMGQGASAPALVEQNNAVALGVEDSAMVRRAASARPPVDEYRRDSLRVAARLPVHHLAVTDIEQT